MDIAPIFVDVNVHPTKHEVHFLHEDTIIHKIQSAVDILLKSASTSRSFTVQVNSSRQSIMMNYLIIYFCC